jgi:NADP-dependent 3-hydroxy acid dehydrogenase YdfG
MKKMKRVILITGASSGMGKEAAKKLILEGHTVYTAARRINQMLDLQEMGGHPLKMDVTDEADIEHVVNTIIEKEGKIDVLWNNAGFGLYGSVEDVSLDDARKEFEVNVFGMAAMTQKVVPFMRKAKSGTIINTSSMGGKMYFPMGAWYHASKHAVEGLSDCLRLELKQFNINVVVLEPGFIATEFSSVLLEGFSKIRRDSVYRSMMTKIEEGTRKASEGNGSSSPSVISDTISKIINTNKPKTRYRVGKFAKPMVWMRTYLGDNLFDKIVMSQM